MRDLELSLATGTCKLEQTSLLRSYGAWSHITANTIWHSFLTTAVTPTRYGLPSALFLS